MIEFVSKIEAQRMVDEALLRASDRRIEEMTSPMSDETEEDHPAWKRLKAMHERGDFEKIARMVEIWDSIETMGRAGEMIRKTIVLLGKVLLWFAGIFAAYLAATGDLAKIFGRSSGGQ